MKKFVAMMVAAMMALSFSLVAVAAEEKAVEKPTAEKGDKVDKKGAKKDKKVKKGDKKDVKKEEGKKDEAKPAKKGKKEVSGC